MQDNDTLRHRPYLYEIGDTFETRHGIMTVIDRSRSDSQNKISRKQYTLQCEKGHQYPVKEAYLKAGRLRTCKKCNHPTITEMDPAFAAWFVDPAIPRSRTHGCHDKADFYCPQCGKIVYGKSIKNIYKRRHVPCPYCGNGISYPERYLMAFLEQLQIPFVHQYTVKFTKDHRSVYYKYDFYDQKHALIIETHGSQHYEPGTFERVGGYALEKIQKIDAEKAQYAAETLQLQYVALDCRRSEPNWIRREILQKLSFYPLDAVDWTAVRQSANQSVVLQIIELSKQGYTQKQIGEIVHMNPSTVYCKLRQAKKDGLYDGITPQQLHKEKQKQLRQAQQKAKKQKQAEQIQRTQAAQKILEDKLQNLSPSLKLLKEDKTCKSPRFTLLCKVCGREFTKSAASLLKNEQCPWCQKLEELRQKLIERYGTEYEILGSYSNCRTPLHIHHKICGEVFYKTPSELFRHGCPACARLQRAKKTAASKQRKSTEKFFSLLPEFKRRGYTYAGQPFHGFGKPTAFYCRHCGQLWQTTPSSILHGRDHICISPCRKKTGAEFMQQVYELVGNEYSVLGNYQTAFTPIKLRHNVCGLEYFVTPAHFTSTGRRCPVCSENNQSKAKHQERLVKAQTLYKNWEHTLQTDRLSQKGILQYI